ncbi:unnamed protein product [Wuchereria bancrofti]|uniref:Uncharacterized protein n=1 Tax=Wuchereria bancrofti TaxID=6293 RepID=A0A3P7DIR4_WUCBA|nr:unnamed protein product [Wuchereria bancrofti]
MVYFSSTYPLLHFNRHLRQHDSHWNDVIRRRDVGNGSILDSENKETVGADEEKNSNKNNISCCESFTDTNGSWRKRLFLNNHGLISQGL